MAPAGQPLELVVLEQADDAVFAVIAGVADDVAAAQPGDRLGEQRRAGTRDVLDRHRLQDRKLRAEPGDQPGRSCARPPCDAGAAGRRARTGSRAAAPGSTTAPAVGGGATCASLRSASISTRCSTPIVSGWPQTGQRPPCGERLLRREPHVAFAVAVEMILALLGEELDRADVAVAGLERVADGEVVELAVEEGRLAPELAGRMGVGVGDQTIAVEERHPPVHRRIGGQPGLDREDVVGEIAVAVGDRVEAGLRSERREPRRPDMRRDQVGVGTGFQRDLQEVARSRGRGSAGRRRRCCRCARAAPTCGRRSRSRARRSGDGLCGSGRPSCRWSRSPPRA